MAGCDEVWAAELDEEAKSLVRQAGDRDRETFRVCLCVCLPCLHWLVCFEATEVYQRDYDLICREFGHCNFGEATCLRGVPGMCPEHLFQWHEEAKMYMPRGS